MGKSNRIRSNRAAQKAAAPLVKQKKGMPSWLITLISIILTVAILLTVALTWLSSTGIFLRMRTAMETENYKVNGSMMSYFFATTYQTVMSSSQNYLTALGLDTSISLKKQTYAEGMTWFDYFMDSTKEQVRELLVYCEEADARGIALTQEELDAIDLEIENIGLYASLYGYPSASSYIAAMYGTGISENDIRKSLKLSHLADKCKSAIIEEFDNALPFDSAEILAEYEKNKNTYNDINYSLGAFTVKYEDALIAAGLSKDASADEISEKKEAIETEFKRLVEEAKANQTALYEMKSQSEFEKKILSLYLDSIIDNTLKLPAKTENTENNGEAAAQDDAASTETETDYYPTEEVFEAIKTALYEKILSECLNGKTDADTTDDSTAIEGDENNVTLFKQTVTKKFAEEVFAAKKTLLKNLNEKKTSSFLTDMKYTETEFLKWAFGVNPEGDRALLDTWKTSSGYKDGDAINSETTFSASTYMLTALPAPDTTPSRDIGFATFSTEDAAKAAIEALKAKGETITYDDFIALMKEKSALSTDKLEDYAKGDLGVAAFDTWAYGDELKIGGYTTAPITVDSAYVVAMYIEDGVETWKVTVKNTVVNEKIAANYEALLTKYAPVDYPKAINKVNA